MKQITLLFFLITNISVLTAQNLTGVRIYVNPGHGGYDSDDRNVPIHPYAVGDQNGFWESKSNLDKGLALRTMLQSSGAAVAISRTTNTTADDLPLSQIVSAANTFNADFMLSIHTNAGNGVASYVLQIHYGSDLSDSQIYPSYNPGNATQFARSNKSRDISTEIAKNLHSNQLTTWSSGYQVRGDKTFARTIMGWSDGYGVLKNLTVPGVISENGMHDYIPETYRLMNMEYKWLEAWNFYKSFCNYFNGGQITTGVIAGQVRDSRIKNEATYHKFAGVDQMLPLNGTKLTVLETNQTYTVDNMNNGVFVFKDLAPGTYNIKAEKSGYYSKTQEITVTAHNISYYNFGLNRVRNTAPQVLSYTPNVSLPDSVNASTSITLQFNWDMDAVSTEQAFSISPLVSGKFSWEDTNYRLRFTPDKPFEKNTLYSVTLHKSASHPDNLSMVENFSFQFQTKNRNRLNLLASYPNALSGNIYTTNPNFRFIFDGKLYTGNLNTAIKVVDAAGNIISKGIRSVINNSILTPYGSHYFNLANNLTEGNSYRIIIDGTVADEIDMPVVEPIEIPFKAMSLPLITETPTIDFETQASTFNASMSEGATNSLVEINSLNKLFGTSANKLSTSLNTVGSKAVFTFNTAVKVNSTDIISAYINGDLSYNRIELVLTTTTETRFVTLCDLNFSGWELREISLESLTQNTEYQLTGIRINRVMPYLFAANTAVLFDNLFVHSNFYSSLKNNSSSNLKIFPNPANEKVRIRTDNNTPAELKLMHLNGQVIRKSFANEIRTSDIPAGIYILEVINNKSIHRQSLIINH